MYYCYMPFTSTRRVIWRIEEDNEKVEERKKNGNIIHLLKSVCLFWKAHQIGFAEDVIDKE